MDFFPQPSPTLPAGGGGTDSGWPLELRIALRDFRGGVRGFWVFLAAIALGVAAITGIGSLSLSIAQGLADEGRVILGGDLSIDLVQREIAPAERAFLARHGRIGEVALVRAMARDERGEAALVEIKAVDRLYPLAGAVVLDPPMTVAEALAERDGLLGIAAEPALLAKLGLAQGDRVAIGDSTFVIRAVLAKEPDRLAGGIGLGARVLMPRAGLEAAGLLEPGALVRWHYRFALGEAEGHASDPAIEGFAARLREAFPHAGWEIRTYKSISPQLSRNLERVATFLGLVGVTSLVIGGVGVANAIAGFVDRKRATIAILKALGATGSRVFGLMLTQVVLVTLLAVLIGVVTGAALPYVAASTFGALIPFPLSPALHPSAMAEGALYGLLTALAFSLWPLGRTHDLPVQALFRDEIEPRRARPRRRYILLAAAACAGLAAAVFAFSADRRLTMIYAGATLAALVLLRIVAAAIMLGAAKLPRSGRVALRLAIANIHRPGALTPSVVLSLGLGLALVVALALIDANIRGELRQGLPGETPSFFFIDIQPATAGAFTDFLREKAPDGRIDLVPMLRGRIVELNGMRADTARPKDQVAWALQGDRGITFSSTVPNGSTLVAGAWWPADYDGPPLVSLEADVASGLGLALGDEIAVNVLGREIKATIANLRKVNWRSYGINFVLVYSPNTFAGAPFGALATLTFPQGFDQARELALVREAAQAFPSVTSIRVKEALDTVNAAIGEVGAAVRAASGVALAAAILVLGGALASGQQARVHDAVVLKTLGATRRTLLVTLVLEFGLVGLATALFGLAAGTAAAAALVEHVLKFEFTFLWPAALAAAAAALALTILLGLAATWHVLGRSPGPYLREL